MRNMSTYHNELNLHVVVSIECFIADRASELGRADKDLSWGRNPVLSFN